VTPADHRRTPARRWYQPTPAEPRRGAGVVVLVVGQTTQEFGGGGGTTQHRYTPGQETTSHPTEGEIMTLTNRSGYRCREHHTQSVTFRGKGCQLCPTVGIKKSKRRKPKPVTPDQEWTWTQ
jgi:hypothetical protein